MNEEGVTDDAPPSYFADGEELQGGADFRCPTCNTSLLDLYKDGRMGCADCYVTFRSTVHRALIVLHGAHTHVGKTIQSDSNY